MRGLSKLMQISIFKTLYANLKLLPFNQAIRLPIVIGRHTALNLSGGGTN